MLLAVMDGTHRTQQSRSFASSLFPIGNLRERNFMHGFLKTPLFAVCLVLPLPAMAQVSTPLPAAIAAPGEKTVATFHAEGAQIYQCKAGADGKLAWQAREPIATLLLNGETVGRHYAGPSWEHVDGSAVAAKLAARAPGATPNDIPWLKLDVTRQRGNGVFNAVTTVQRINTQGGMAEGPCERPDTFRSVPYSADYVFLGKGT
jgi:uncharacterized protein DUF3455